MSVGLELCRIPSFKIQNSRVRQYSCSPKSAKIYTIFANSADAEKPTYLPPVLFGFPAERDGPPLLGTSRLDEWLAARMADLTSLLQVLLSLGSDLASPYEEQSFFSSRGQDFLGRPLSFLLVTLRSYVVFSPPSDLMTWPYHLNLFFLRTDSRSNKKMGQFPCSAN